MDPFIEALDAKVVNANCPVCDENSWSTVEDLVHILMGSEEQVVTGRPWCGALRLSPLPAPTVAYAADALRGV